MREINQRVGQGSSYLDQQLSHYASVMAPEPARKPPTRMEEEGLQPRWIVSSADGTQQNSLLWFTQPRYQWQMQNNLPKVSEIYVHFYDSFLRYLSLCYANVGIRQTLCKSMKSQVKSDLFILGPAIGADRVELKPHPASGRRWTPN